jgi:hypothetical protein
MKIYRGPRIGGSWTLTDSKTPSDYIKEWSKRRQIVFDGTIDKDGLRHTELAMEIEEEDVFALFNSILNGYREQIESLNKKLHDGEEKYIELQRGFSKIDDLIEYHAEDAPTEKSVARAVQSIARYYGSSLERKRVPRIGWLRIAWDRL